MYDIDLSTLGGYWLPIIILAFLLFFQWAYQYLGKVKKSKTRVPVIISVTIVSLLIALLAFSIISAGNSMASHNSKIEFRLVVAAFLLIFTFLSVKLIRFAKVTFGKDSYLYSGTKVLAILILIFLLNNQMSGGGITIPFTIFVLSALTMALWVLRRFPLVKRIIHQIFWIGLAYLVISGVMLNVLSLDITYFHTGRLHSYLGFLWVPFFFVYMIEHLLDYERMIGDSKRKIGFYSGLLITIGLMSGVIHVYSGAESFTTARLVHSLPLYLGIGLLLVHIYQSVMQSRKRGWDRIAQQFWPSKSQLVFAGMVTVLLLGYPYVVSHSPEELTGEYSSWSQAERKAKLDNGVFGITACSQGGTGIPRKYLNEIDAPLGCGRTFGCHNDIAKQWERSAHRLAGSAAYQKAVRLVQTDLGYESARLCASCHDPAKGWSNGEAFATGVNDQVGGRSAPTVINTAYNYFQFWDGRAGSLEEQALGPIENPIEMALPLDEAVNKLNAIAGYRRQFQKVFGTDVTQEGIGKAIAAFERTVLSGDAPYDRFVNGDESSLSEAAQRGRKLFFAKAHCSACHVGSNFTDNAFHNLGVSINRDRKSVV